MKNQKNFLKLQLACFLAGATILSFQVCYAERTGGATSTDPNPPAVLQNQFNTPAETQPAPATKPASTADMIKQCTNQDGSIDYTKLVSLLIAAFTDSNGNIDCAGLAKVLQSSGDSQIGVNLILSGKLSDEQIVQFINSISDVGCVLSLNVALFANDTGPCVKSPRTLAEYTSRDRYYALYNAPLEKEYQAEMKELEALEQITDPAQKAAMIDQLLKNFNVSGPDGQTLSMGGLKFIIDHQGIVYDTPDSQPYRLGVGGYDWSVYKNMSQDDKVALFDNIVSKLNNYVDYGLSKYSGAPPGNTDYADLPDSPQTSQNTGPNATVHIAASKPNPGLNRIYAQTDTPSDAAFQEALSVVAQFKNPNGGVNGNIGQYMRAHPDIANTLLSGLFKQYYNPSSGMDVQGLVNLEKKYPALIFALSMGYSKPAQSLPAMSMLNCIAGCLMMNPQQ